MAKAKYAVELKSGLAGAQFNVGGVEVELTADSPVFETDDQGVYVSLLGHPFLKPRSGKEG